MKIWNENFKIYSNKIAKSYTFSVIADIHNTKYISYKLWQKLISEVKKQKPNYIFIPGDIIYTSDDIISSKNKDKLEYLLKGLGEIAPVFISLGNHDLKSGKKSNYHEAIKYFKLLETKIKNISFLDNESVDIDNLHIIGFSPRFETYYEKTKTNWSKYFHEDLRKCHFKLDKNKYNILLTHSPRIIALEETQKLINNFLNNIDLILCGHMHDGLMPRFVQKLGLVKDDHGLMASEGDSLKEVTFGKVDKCRGLHNIKNAKLIVTRGIVKWCQPNPLFGLIDKICAKDITTIKLNKKL